MTAQFNIGILYSRIASIRTAARQGLAIGAQSAAHLIEAEAKALVPVLTGALRDSIHTEHTIDTSTRQEWAITPVYPASNKYGFTPPYARRIEYGFVGYDSLGRFFNQAAQPYMRPAYDTKKAEAEQLVRDAIFNAVQEAIA